MAFQPWTIEPVAGPCTFTEGPVWDGQALRFTDIRASRIMRFDPRTGVCEPFAEDTNKANGLALDREGRLIVCEGTVAELFWQLPAVGDERLCWSEAVSPR